MKVRSRTLERNAWSMRLVIFTVWWIVMAGACYGQCQPHLPAQCQQLNKEREDLIAEQKALQADMKDAAGQQKASIASQIKNLAAKIAAKQKLADSCTAANGLKDLPATFGTTGIAALKLLNNPQPGTPDQPLFADLMYVHWAHDQVVVSDMAPLSYVLSGKRPQDYAYLGANPHFSSGCGAVNPKTGQLSLTLTVPVLIKYRLPGNRFEDAFFSNLAITLSTENPGGSRLDGKGKIKLAGDGVFQDGILKGNSCRTFVEGTLLPLP